MAITRVQVATGSTTARTSYTAPTLASPATAGNLLVVAWAVDKNAGTFTAPAGWTVLADQPGASVSLLVVYKIAAGGDAAPTASWTANEAPTALITEYSGVNTSSPVGPSHLPAYSDTARTSLALNPAAATSAGAALAFLAIDSFTTSGSTTDFRPTATGFTWAETAFDPSVSGNAGIALVEDLTIASGEDIAPTFTWTRSDQVSGFIVLLNDAGLPPVGTVSWMWTAPPTGTQVAVTIRTSSATSVRLKVGTDSTVTSGVFFTSAATPDADGYSTFAVTGLAAGTDYWYQAEVDSVLLASRTGWFQTDQPGTARSFRVAFGSCQFGSGAASTAYTNLMANSPELLLHLGDFHYGDSASTSVATQRGFYESYIGGTSGLQQVLYKVPTAYTPSDHDSGGDGWTTGAHTPAWNTAVRQVMPTLETLPSGGIYRSVHRGRVKFIITDGRSYKTDPFAADGASKSMFGLTQEAWIADELADPAYPVKVLCMEQPWVFPTVPGGDDSWGGYRACAQRLVDAITAADANVFIIHGDAHSLSADDGTSANNLGDLPVAGAAPFRNSTSVKGGPYSQGTYPVSGATGATESFHGLLDITDTGDEITIRYSGRDTSNTERVALTTAFALTETPPAIDRLRLGTGTVSLRVGPAAASRAYIGTTQVWP